MTVAPESAVVGAGTRQARMVAARWLDLQRPGRHLMDVREVLVRGADTAVAADAVAVREGVPLAGGKGPVVIGKGTKHLFGLDRQTFVVRACPEVHQGVGMHIRVKPQLLDRAKGGCRVQGAGFRFRPGF